VVHAAPPRQTAATAGHRSGLTTRRLRRFGAPTRSTSIATTRRSTTRPNLTTSFKDRYGAAQSGHRPRTGRTTRRPTYAATDLFTNGRPPIDGISIIPIRCRPISRRFAPTGATSDASAQSAAVYAFDTLKLTDKVQTDLGPALGPRLGGLHDRIDGRRGRELRPGRPGAQAAVPASSTNRFAPRDRSTARFSTSFNPSFDGAFGLTLASTGVNNSALPPEPQPEISRPARKVGI